MFTPSVICFANATSLHEGGLRAVEDARPYGTQQGGNEIVGGDVPDRPILRKSTEALPYKVTLRFNEKCLIIPLIWYIMGS